MIRIQKVIFFYEQRIEAPLDKIQNVNTSQTSPLSKFLNFGDVTIGTAGPRGTIVFKDISNPNTLERQILSERSRYVAGLRAEETYLTQSHAAQDLRTIIFGPQDVPPDAAPPPAQGPSAVAKSSTAPPRFQKLRELYRYFLPNSRIDENGKITWRKHWIELVQTTGLLSLLWLGLTIFILIQTLSPTTLIANFPRSATTFLLIIVIALILAIWYLYEDWRNDIYVLDENNIFDIYTKPLALGETKENAPLDKIQDITFIMPNPLSKLLNYGDVIIRTASEKGEFTFYKVSNPSGVMQEIQNRQHTFEIRRQQENARIEATRRRTELYHWFSTYNDLHQQPPPNLPPSPPSSKP